MGRKQVKALTWTVLLSLVVTGIHLSGVGRAITACRITVLIHGIWKWLFVNTKTGIERHTQTLIDQGITQTKGECGMSECVCVKVSVK